MSITEPIRNPVYVHQITDHCLKQGNLRNALLIVIGMHTALRISDILRITWDDVYDFQTGQFRTAITIVEKKTKKAKIIVLNQRVIDVLKLYLSAAKPGKTLILNKRTGKAISRIQAYRIIRSIAEALELPIRVSCHSLRKTFGYMAWKNGVSPAVIMEIYNHSSFAVTRRYLGITQDDKNEVYQKLAQIL